jgi:hypothetical protein
MQGAHDDTAGGSDSLYITHKAIERPKKDMIDSDAQVLLIKQKLNSLESFIKKHIKLI